MTAELKAIAPACKALQRAAKLGSIKNKAHYAEMTQYSGYCRNSGV